MTPARPLREVFAGLAGQPSADPGEVLAAHSAVPTGEPAEPTDWHHLLSTAPDPDLSEVDTPFETAFGAGAAHEDADPATSLDFGAGAEPDHHAGAELTEDTVPEIHHEHHAVELDWTGHHDPAALLDEHHHHVVGDDDLPDPDDA